MSPLPGTIILKGTFLKLICSYLVDVWLVTSWLPLVLWIKLRDLHMLTKWSPHWATSSVQIFTVKCGAPKEFKVEVMFSLQHMQIFSSGPCVSTYLAFTYQLTLPYKMLCLSLWFVPVKLHNETWSLSKQHWKVVTPLRILRHFQRFR